MKDAEWSGKTACLNLAVSFRAHPAAPSQRHSRRSPVAGGCRLLASSPPSFQRTSAEQPAGRALPSRVPRPASRAPLPASARPGDDATWCNTKSEAN